MTTDPFTAKRRIDTSVPGYIERVLLGINTAMPGIVTSYDAVTRRAVVQPSFKIKLRDGTTISRAPLIDVPVMVMGAGGFSVSFPVTAGEKVLLVVAQRSMDEFKLTLEESDPGDRRFSLQDAVAILGFPSELTAPASGAAFQKDDGSVAVMIDDDLALAKVDNREVRISDTAIRAVSPNAEVTLENNLALIEVGDDTEIRATDALIRLQVDSSISGQHRTFELNENGAFVNGDAVQTS